MRTELTGKVAIVTGGAGAIGKGVALGLAAAGAKVVVNDLGVGLDGAGGDRSAAQLVVDEIRASGGEAIVNTDSVSDWAAAQQIATAAMDTYGRLDIVVNNAGNLRDRMFFRMSEQEWRAVIDVHLNGTFFVSRAAAPYFKDQQSGAYVHMTSTSGLIGNLGQANYAAAKLGIVALSKSIALDMARFGVRSNCIAPFAWSRMTDSLPTETEAQRARVAKFQRMEAHKIAPMAVFLAGEAASAVNGQIFAVRANEIMLMSQPRPVRSVHMSEGWSAQSIAEVALPAMHSSFMALERSPEVIGWDPI
ncbi:SDR family NAD(P)-dependent oxidoreductase [Bordetella trematum]|uniref:SDR family NAD(P)-dependent oxidoreductase n=1 Tax=Bordetella trematum TaxID=123899 RepID=UPI000D8F6A1F|nr:SDR family NAD(P)-dependent oxidoreductase [Bordetella trematum]SPU49748.1 short-chain dehydrogenase [Bordetella trematum]VDH07497.1 Putative short-chain type dehydrogenase/reductase Rv0148 [Bordetella trematum]